MTEHSFTCPKCGSSDIRRSRTQTFREVPNQFLGVYPFRCLSCGNRFFGNVWVLATRGHTNCPKCLRLNVTPSPIREMHLSWWDRMRISLGAHSYRCTPCRYSFLSFRKCVAQQPRSRAVETDLEHPEYPSASSGDLG